MDDANGFVRLEGNDIALRRMTVVNDLNDAGNFSIAVSVGDVSVPTDNWRLEDLVVRSREAISNVTAINFKAADCAGGRMTNVVAVADTGAGSISQGVVFACLGAASLSVGTNVELRGQGSNSRGLQKLSTSTLRLQGSVVSGGTFSIRQTSGTVQAVATEIDGTLDGAVLCIGAYDESATALSDGENGMGGCS